MVIKKAWLILSPYLHYRRFERATHPCDDKSEQQYNLWCIKRLVYILYIYALNFYII